MHSASSKSIPSRVKRGLPITIHHFNNLLTTLLKAHHQQGLLLNLFSQILANSIPITPRTRSLVAAALLASGRLRDAVLFISFAPGASGSPPRRRFWDALLRHLCLADCGPSRVMNLLMRLGNSVAPPSPVTLRMLVSAFCARGDVESAVKVFDIMPEPVDDYVCSSIVSGFSKLGEARRGLEFYDSVRRRFDGFVPNLATVTAVVDVLGKEGRVEEAADLVQTMEDKGMVGDAALYGSLVCGYLRGGFLMEGLRKHRWMLCRGVTPDVVSYTNVIDSLCKEGNVEKVIGFLDEMEKRKIKPNLVTYTSLIGGFCRRNKLEDAFVIVRKLEETGVVIDEHVHSILVDSLCKKGDLDGAFTLLEQMEKKGIKIRTVTYNAVINGLCKVGDTNRASEISECLVADNFTYSTLLHGYMKEKDAAGVIEIMAKLENGGISIDVVTCNVLIKELFMIDKVDDACNLFRKMPEMGLVANSVTYCTMIDGMCKHGKIEQALELFDEYRKSSSFSSAAAHNCMIRGLCKEGKIDMAVQVFQDLAQRNIYPDAIIYQKLIRAHFREGGEEAVLSLVRKMKGLDSELFSLVCNDASAFLSTRNCCGAALDVYKFLRTQAFTITTKTCYILLKSLLRNGSDLVIQPLLSECIKIHGADEPRMVNLLSCYLGKKNVGEAIRFSNYMGNRTVPVSVLRAAVYAFKKQGAIEDAYNFLREAEQNGLSVDLAIYSIVVDGLCRGGYLEKALDLCRNMKEEGIHPNIIIHNSILNGLCQEGCLTEAFRLFDSLEYNNVFPTVITYAILIGALCREGFLDDANQLFQHMTSRGIMPNTHIYNLLISGYCNFGLLEDAQKLISCLDEHSLRPDAFTISSIINGYCLQGNVEGALDIFMEFRCREIVPDFVGFMSLVKGFCSKGRMEEGRGILREMFQCKEVVDLINSAGDDIHAESLVSLLSLACEQGRIHEVVTILNEVGLISMSSLDSSSYDRIAQSKLRRAGNADAVREDSEQLFYPAAAYEVPKNFSHDRNTAGTTKAVKDKPHHLINEDGYTNTDYQHLLGKSLYDDFDTYYPVLASLCSRGELLKADNAVKAMIQNSV